MRQYRPTHVSTLIATRQFLKEFSDMVSHKHRFIFIHVPKTAGTSIEKKFGLFEDVSRNAQDHRSIREIEPLTVYGLFAARNVEDLKFAGYRFKHHRLKGQEVVTPEQYRSYFKFAFVRNSWSRVFSMYKNMMRFEPHRRNFGVADDCTFSEFVEKHLGIRQLRPQLFWLRDSKGEIPLDFIGRFENLADDFAYICDVLKTDDKSLPWLLPSDGSHYVDFYDDQSKDLVYQRFQEEIDHFEFIFGE
jgi:hypothetical protein